MVDIFGLVRKKKTSRENRSQMMAEKRRNSLAYPMTYDLKQGHRNPH